ncbi:hypothetical protein FD725_16275 [Nostoc sp. TCL26-01]|nr:hypothetical protein FD725_16275 [Nostoc sp. TCL26-01]
MYSFLWQRLRLFPQSLAEGSHHPPNVSGPAAAALISAGIGCLIMMVTQHLVSVTPEIEKIVWDIGSWIPGSHNANKLYGEIGSYSGKETILLISWLVSWVVLHYLWRNRNIKVQTMFFWIFVLFIAATVMSWHPLFSYLPLM